MYHAHFGLERSLFGDGIATETAVFRTPKHDRLIAHFKLALASPTSAIVLHGPAGVGKTTLTSAALRASSTRLALAWIGGMASNAAELLELILLELGINTLRTTRIERLQLWRQFQAETRATDSRLFIVAERAEDLSAEVLHALDQLTAPDAAGNPGANLVLLGHAGLDEHLAAPLLDSLRQRIRLRTELEPFTEAELQDYLRHQVACSGGSFDRIFAPGTVAALHRYTRGVARLANTLCESALDIAAVQQHKQLTAELVAKTAVSLLGLAEPGVPALRGAERSERAAPSGPPAMATGPTPMPLAATLAPLAPVVPLPIAAPATTPLPVAPAAGVLPPVAPAASPPPPPPAPIVAAQPAPVPVVAVPALPPAPVLSPPPMLAAAAPTSPKPDVEYDGSATDVADVALADFPVLTDAVELPAAEPVAKRVATPLPVPPPAAALPAMPHATAKPAAKPAAKVETAYAVARPAAKPVAAAAPAATSPPPAPAAAPRLAAAKPPAAPVHSDDDDVLRQTQTMRAIAGAKSIDDLTELDAETLFSDAELDLVSAALASAAEWPDDDLEPVAAPAPPPPRAEPEAKKVAPPIDDPFDFLGLGDDAPLELIDDSAPPPNDRTRTAVSR
jgi:type II secretory pathway predicted ATPase ExeA